ncbi:hypothetical protein GYH30_052287 [Glycine max]|nr:hypothetical protein GYH30_052287 [Glycine max]
MDCEEAQFTALESSVAALKTTTRELKVTTTKFQKLSKKQTEVIAKVSKQCDDIKDLRKMMKMLMEQKGIMYNDTKNASMEQNNG